MENNHTNPIAEQDMRMAQSYKYIAKQLAAFSKQMLNRIGIIQNGGGIIDDTEVSDTLNELANMINSCLYSVSDSRVTITMNPNISGHQ